MTRETKIGLLVGLAFIILFGIILSEKGTGRDQLSTTPMTAYEPVVELVPSADPERFQLVQNNPSPSDRPGMSQSSAGHAAPDPSAGQPTPTPVQRQAPPAPQPMELAPKMREILPSGPTRPLVRIPASSSTSSDPAAVVEVRQPKQINIAPAETAAPQLAMKTHHVQPGETLLGICSQFYPGRAYQMLKIVMAANDISKPEKLQAGQTIKLPTLEGPTDALASTAPPPANAQSPPLLVSVSHSPVGFNLSPRNALAVKKLLGQEAGQPRPGTPNAAAWYVVKSKDTLSKIARQFYGNEKAWLQLYEWNKDIISEPNALRDGQKIRLPLVNNGLAAGKPSAD